MNNNFDVIIVGAGIQGAGVARLLAANGYRVAVVERHKEAGFETSSRSSKLIHGGLRYLETGQFSLVKECLFERESLLQYAPEYVKLVPFYIPIYKFTRRRPWLISIGLRLYQLLTKLSHWRFGKARQSIQVDSSHISKLSKADIQQQLLAANELKSDKLESVYQYYDAQTDDQKLTQAICADASKLGATFFYHSEVRHISISDNEVNLTLNEGEESGTELSLSTQLVINASGPWVNHLLDSVQPEQLSIPLQWVQGTHLIIDRPLSNNIYYVESRTDQRAIFIMPWQERTLIGTTEKVLQRLPDTIEPSIGEVDYLVKVYNDYMSNPIGHDDIVERFAGVRVLPCGDEKSFSRPREVLLATDNSERPRLISLCGGKLTAFQDTAEKVYQQIQKTLPNQDGYVDVRKRPLS